MSVSLKVDGFKDLEKQLAQLKQGTSRGVARRAMKKSLKPVEDMANAFWPGANDKAFITSSRVKASQRSHRDGRNVLNMLTGSHEPVAHLLEFGTGPRFQKNGRYTGAISPMPMLQPAWDANKDEMIATLSKILGEEIQKTMARLAAKGE